MRLFWRTFIVLVIPVLTACGSEGSGAPATQAESTFDKAVFDTSTWK